jgi:spore photoproduct lyase
MDKIHPIEYTIDPSLLNGRNAIVVSREQGEFWKPCPGTTKGYYCCGYQIITPMTGCGMYCRYCVLQAYLENPAQVVYENIDDLEKEIARKMTAWKGVVRFGTGEFGDSLFLEDKFHLSERIAAMLDPYPNAIVEFKTKSTNVAGLAKIKDPRKVIVGFSMNTPAMIELHERNTASLRDRLEAARECLSMGFRVAFHFDPIIYYPHWKRDYAEVVRQIFDYVKDPSRIAWWSLGGFRSAPGLKEHLKKSGMHLPLFSAEMITGEDGKYRYFRPVRVEFYSTLCEEIERRYPDVPVYLCMESPEVWEASGMMKRIPHGLAGYLDARAEKMLGNDFRKNHF